MNDRELAEIRERAESYLGIISNPTLIKILRDDVPKLLDEVERHDAQMKTMGHLIHSKRKEIERLQKERNSLLKQRDVWIDQVDKTEHDRDGWKRIAEEYQQKCYDAEKERDEWKAKAERLEQINYELVEKMIQLDGDSE